MKKAHGTLWRYTNSNKRITWAAEMKYRGSLFTAFGQKKSKYAIAAANKAAKLLGWELDGPWERLADKCSK